MEIVWALVGFVVFMVVGNVAIAVVSALARRKTPNAPLPTVAGVKHLHAVDTRVWRSSAPSRDAYAALAGRGVRTVVDLRAERDVRDDERFLAEHGVELVRLPIRDGQTPTRAQVETALSVIRSSGGIVLVHCGAGVGRTGTVVAAHLTATGAATPRQTLWRNLAVGPPSLEQIWYVANLDGEFDQPPFAVRAVSRALDAPRRIWSRVRHAR